MWSVAIIIITLFKFNCYVLSGKLFQCVWRPHDQLICSDGEQQQRTSRAPPCVPKHSVLFYKILGKHNIFQFGVSNAH